jgi:hypothetical protein
MALGAFADGFESRLKTVARRDDRTDQQIGHIRRLHRLRRFFWIRVSRMFGGQWR